MPHAFRAVFDARADRRPARGERLTRLFHRDEYGQPADLRRQALLQNDPHFRDYLLFYEYFHGDNGRGLGAPHQTGWTGLIAKLLMPRQKEG